MWIDDSNELQKVSHLVRSPLNFFSSSFGSLTLELLISATAWWVTGVTVALVTTVGVLVSGAVVVVWWAGGVKPEVVKACSLLVTGTVLLVTTSNWCSTASNWYGTASSWYCTRHLCWWDTGFSCTYLVLYTENGLLNSLFKLISLLNFVLYVVILDKSQICSSNSRNLSSFSFNETLHCINLSNVGPASISYSPSSWCINLVADDLLPARTFLILARASDIVLDWAATVRQSTVNPQF